MRLAVFLLLLASLCVAPAAWAGDAQTEAIRAAAFQALGADPAQAEATLAPGLGLVACAQPLQAVASGLRTALVRCPDSPGWKLYVPVRVHREGDVVVLRGPVPAGVPITADQLVVQRRDLADAAGPVLADPAAVVGRTPSRALAAGAALTGADLAAGPPLKRGDPVVLLTRIGPVEVRVGGRALGPAQAGGVVTAENTESHRIVRGRVTAPGVVEVLQ